MKATRHQTRRPLSAEDKISIALQGLRGEDSIAAFCSKEGIAQSLYYTFSAWRLSSRARVHPSARRVWIKPEGIKHFAGDLSEQEQKLVWATHYPPAADLLEQQKLDEVAWKSKLSWFILARKDQTVHPEPQRFLAKRMNATTIETNNSHVIMLSRPDLVIEVIRKAVAAVQQGQSK